MFPKRLQRKLKVRHARVEDKILIRYLDNQTIKKRDDFQKRLNLSEISIDIKSKERSKRTINSGELRWLSKSDKKKFIDAEFGSMNQSKEVDWIAPVYSSGKIDDLDAMYSPHPFALLISLKENVTSDKASKLIEKLKAGGLLENDKKSKYLKNWRYFELDRSSGIENVYLLKDQLEKKYKGSIKQIRYENIPLVKPLTYTPNDSLYGSQWNMPQINAPAAWDISEGHEGVVIAVLDEGVDLSHPDLRFHSNGIRLDTLGADGSPTGNHGTACAGIAAATTDNSTGVAGVAGECEILPIAFVNWSDVEAANGISYAADEGADVLSMSFGQYDAGEGLFPATWDFDIIDPSIEDAYESGVTLVAATGNEDIGTFNRYPSRHNLVMAVGASSTDDNRKTTTSPDGENWWGANFAAGVSVVAPGVLIPTTDRTGAVGYATGNYTMNFNGTSSATPHVAGLAGAVIATNPYLANRDVQDVIEQSAAKVGTIAYSTAAGFDNGTRNNQMGYGRIDAEETLEESSFLFVTMNELINQ